jgi:hypothetical protein
MPSRIVVPSEADAQRLIGKEGDGRQFRTLAEATITRFPALAPFVSRKPLVLLDLAADWPRILDALAWFCAHPQSNRYLRQIDAAGVHTKFRAPDIASFHD